ncbi:patatin-like phospholipase family protein [Paramaledivibacter caminithermalis]|jgi:predicted patatin/cPLA2 family phospholipase|uniref:Predicted phospholipase, patatin/cPLA2 family n=1 Tax=Paramaledivibacter caminithermalis (strain DSM 15212 / CIP 107654 / DViRD3) TaxID=1121301 RepID=A0A1M6PU86_PARC5|nr:patatin family protein [Paramaledivibacter caminithermalis]SHK11476.1 Predicted phospholipase, patatin/cPLA2 family [Paramaledivibacter caminithermalis DSM 15212]
MKDVGLVLQGGGMRGVYTSGVLDFFMDKELYFSYIIAVSAGACNAIAYILKQRGFGKRIYIDYIKKNKYISYKNLLTKGSILDMDFIFHTIPNTLEPFDFEKIKNSNKKFVITATDCSNGQPVYIDVDNCDDVITAIKASSSIPFLTKTVEFEEKNLLDGAISDPIPIKKAMEDGNHKSIIVLTNENGHKQKPFKMKGLARKIYPDYNDLVKSISNCHRVYHKTIDYINELEAKKKVFIIRPSKYLKLKTFDKNTKKIESLYKLGYMDAENKYNELIEWLKV